MEGFENLIIKLNNLVNIEAVSKAVTNAALRVERAAKENCPADDGTLKGLITHLLTSESNSVTGAIGTSVEYAPYVEFGTGLFAVEGNGRKTPWSYCDEEGKWHHTAGQMPQPFLYPAFNNNKQVIIDEIAEALKKEIKGV